MSKKKTEAYLKYLQNHINLGRHPNYYAKLLQVNLSTIIHILARHNLKIKYKSNCFKKYCTNPKAFKNINNEYEAYYLGFIIADGSVKIKRNSKQFSISIQEQDEYILNKLSLICLNKNNIRIISKKKQVGLSFTCNKIVDNLIRYGVIPNKTYETNSFPILKETLMPHFIRGYFDGDGCVYTKKQRYNWGSAVSFTGHYDFISSLENYLKSRNILTTEVKTKQKKHQFDSVFEFEKKKDIKNLYNYMYKDASIFLHRKQKKFII